MSLKTRFGNLGNILDFDNLTEDNMYELIQFLQTTT